MDPAGGPPAERAYVPPTTTGAAWPPAPAPAAWPPPRPQNVGVAAACTIAVGAIALLGALALIVAALAAGLAFGIADFYAGPWTGPIGRGITGLLLVLALVPLTFGIIGLVAGFQLNARPPGGWTAAVIVHVVSLAVGLLTVWGLVGLVHAVPSAVAMWALFQADTRAYLGHAVH